MTSDKVTVLRMYGAEL